RLTEFFVNSDPIARKEARLLEEAVEDALTGIDPALVGKHRRLVGAAGTTGAVAQLARRLSGAPGGSGAVSRDQVHKVLEQLRNTTAKQRRKLGVDESRIDVMYAGTAILEGVMRKLRVEEMEVTARGLRDGLMADLVRREVRPPASGLHGEHVVLEGLRAFGRRCGYREPHAEQVAQLSLALFDQTRTVHRLGAEERALLHAAAMLHDVGSFVSYNRHHKHGYYLLYHADLPGFTDRERELDDLLRVFPRVGLFDAVVAENGALLYLPDRKQERRLAESPPAEFAAALRRRGVPITTGRVIVATRVPHETTVLQEIKRQGLELQVIFNKGAV